ncbi:MAG: hypothetical protein ABR608_14230 [Pseudonocardiaceae bacterium]
MQLRHRSGLVVVPRVGAGELLDPSLRLMLRALGFHDIIELDAFESLALPDGELLAVPFLGEHSDLDIAGKAGYALHLAGSTAVFDADARCLEPALYVPVRARYGDVDFLFVGMECEGSPMTTANGPYLPPGRHTPEMAEDRRTNASDAVSGRCTGLLPRLCPLPQCPCGRVVLPRRTDADPRGEPGDHVGHPALHLSAGRALHDHRAHPVVHRLGMRAHRPAEGILEPADHHTRQRTERLGWRLVEHTTPEE